jgi:hypothetical protein
MQAKTKLLGDFQIESGRVFVSDPCYDLDTECAKIIENVKNGNWGARIETVKVWGERVSKLMCFHESIGSPRNLLFKIVSKDIGVDSGQAGVFDIGHFKRDSDTDGFVRESKDIICENEPWYSMCCDKTLSKNMAGIIPFGVVSSSGLGDGAYVCEVAKRDNEVVAIQVTFLEDE